MTKPVIAVDFDDVVGDFSQAFANFHNHHHNTSVKYEEIYTYDMWTIYGVDYPTILQRIETFCHHHHESIEPTEGANEVFSALNKQFDLQIVTSRCESLRDITNNWLELRFSGVFTDIHFTNSFGTKYPGKRRTKLSVCQDIGAVLLIDDALSHAQDVAEGGIPVLMPNRPWNQEQTHERVTRVDPLHEATDWILKNIV